MRMPVGAVGGRVTACERVTVRPAMLREAVRGWVPALVWPAKTTVPLPLPVAPAATVIHDACSDADQLQPEAVVTV